MPIFQHAKKGRVLFVHIPKTGGSSISKWLINAGHSVDKINHGSGPGFQHAPREVYETWGHFDYQFTVIRHPLERFVSALGFNRVNKGDVDTVAHRLLANVEHKRGQEAAWGNHLQPQADFLSPKTKIFRFEKDFGAQLGTIFDISDPLPHTNKSKSKIIKADLSDETRKLFDYLYQDDYKVLGYLPEFTFD